MHRRGEVILLVVLCLKGSEASERKTREVGHQTTGGSNVQRANGRARVFIFHFFTFYICEGGPRGGAPSPPCTSRDPRLPRARHILVYYRPSPAQS
jgi:hypothetical protein